MPNTREKLVELIASKECDYYSGVYEKWIEHDCEKCGSENCSVTLLADHLIAHGVTVQEWISVKDRLPEESGEYLAYCGEYDGICVLYFEILETKSKWRTKWKEVTHWMPLPQPPKGE